MNRNDLLAEIDFVSGYPRDVINHFDLFDFEDDTKVVFAVSAVKKALLDLEEREAHLVALLKTEVIA